MVTNKINEKMPVLIIDASYVVKSTTRKIDYLKLKKTIEEVFETKIGEGYYFNSYVNGKQNDEQDKFHNWLKTAEPHGPKIQVLLYPLKESHTRCSNCNFDAVKMVQKGVDVAIASTLCRLSFTNPGTVFFIIAGDGDLKDALDTAKLSGAKMISFGFKATMSPEIQAASHEVFFLDDVLNMIAKN